MEKTTEQLIQELEDAELAEEQRARRHYLFSDECYGQRVRDNKRQVAAMWRTGLKWGGLAALAIFGFLSAVGHSFFGAVVAIALWHSSSSR